MQKEKVLRNVLLPPGAGNPRNSEGAFVRLRDGKVLFVYSHFTGGGGDDDAAHLAGRVSADGGRTWTERDTVVVPNEGGFNVMSVSLLRLPSGEIALFYLRKNSLFDCRPLARFSADEGKTWGRPTEMITDDIAYYVLNNDRVVPLKSGRLVAPVALHRGPDGKFIGRGRALCYLSDDGGKTWRRGRTTLELAQHPDSRYGLQEPGVVELKDGRLLMFCRTDRGWQYFAWSRDGGDTWTMPVPGPLRSPTSPASIKRIPSTGDLLAVWNDKSAAAGTEDRETRTPFAVAVSRDEGRSWGNRKLLEDDPNGWYCYTAIEFVGEDRVLLAHCAGKRRAGGLNTTQITSFPVDWLYS